MAWIVDAARRFCVRVLCIIQVLFHTLPARFSDVSWKSAGGFVSFGRLDVVRRVALGRWLRGLFGFQDGVRSAGLVQGVFFSLA